MTAYPLLTNVTAVGAAATVNRQPAFVAAPGGGAGAPTAPATNESFHAVVTGSGNVSATIHIQVSNDGVNWFDYPTIGTITITSGGAPQQGNTNGSTPWAFYSAYVSAITGTAASVSLTMNA